MLQVAALRRACNISMVMVVMATAMRLVEFARAYVAVAVGVEFSEQGVGALGIDSNRAECLFEFSLADLPVTVRIELRKTGQREIAPRRHWPLDLAAR
ncbi:MAG: hypothetical protein WBX05_13680 [Pseudolabrys sp.]